MREHNDDELDNDKEHPLHDLPTEDINESDLTQNYDANSKKRNEQKGKSKKKLNLYQKSIFKIVGPGVITGASDDDPSGIAT